MNRNMGEEMEGKNGEKNFEIIFPGKNKYL